MRFIFTGVFWGAALILFGFGIISNSLFHLNLPLFQIFWAALLILVGLEIIFGGFRKSGHGKVGYTNLKYDQSGTQTEYGFSFGGGKIDFSEVSLVNGTVSLKVNSSFGGGVVLLNPDQAIEIKATASFGAIVFPDNTNVAFGTAVYHSPAYKKGEPCLQIEANQSFGGIRFVTSKEAAEWCGDWNSDRRCGEDERRHNSQ